MSDPAIVLVMAPNWLGDAVMALPAVDDIRRRFGAARLVVAARPSVSHLFALTPAVDGVIELEPRGRLTGFAARGRNVERLRATGADLAILLPNSFVSAWLVRRAGIAGRWGFAADRRSPLLSRAVPRPERGMHQGAYYQYLVRALGMENGPLEPRVTVPVTAMAAAQSLLAAHGVGEGTPFVVFAPGAAYGTAKRWFPSHFGTLAAALVQQHGVRCVLVGGDGDLETTRDIVSMVPSPVRPGVIDLCGRTGLDTLAGVLAIARACVSNDSGAMHLAAAVGVPLAALFGPTNERETSPLAHAGLPAQVLINPVSCRPCMLRECPIDHPCMRDLDPARVFAAVSEMLARPPAAGAPAVRMPDREARS